MYMYMVIVMIVDKFDCLEPFWSSLWILIKILGLDLDNSNKKPIDRVPSSPSPLVPAGTSGQGSVAELPTDGLVWNICL